MPACGWTRSVSLLSCVLMCFVAASAGADDLSGIWQGKVQVDDQDYRVILHVARQGSRNLEATIDTPDTGKLGIALASFKTNDASVSFEVTDAGISFKGAFSADRSTISGEWKQNGSSASLTLTRTVQAPDFDKDGSYLFQSHCTSCHAPFNATRAPWPTTLQLMSHAAILNALENGKMRAVGERMSHDQRVAVAHFLGQPAVAQKNPVNSCPANSAPMANSPLWNGWGVDLSNSRYQPEKFAGLNKSQLSRLKVKWAFGYAGATSTGSSATVIGERVFVAGGGQVYSLDRRWGCVYWSFVPAAGVRTAITVSDDGKTAFFGDVQGRAYAVDAGNGSLRWQTEVEKHPFAMITGAPKLYAGKLYVPVSSAEELGAANPKYRCCTFRGSVNALDAKTGNVLWRTYTIPEPAQSSTTATGVTMVGPSGAGVWSSPTIDPERHALYFGTGDNYSEPGSATSDAVMALDLESGKVLWVKQLTSDDRFNIACFDPSNPNCPKNPGGDFDIGAPPILRKLASGKSLLLVGQKSGVAYGLDPDEKGAIVWQTRIGKGGPLGGIEFGGAADEQRVYYPLSDFSPDPKTGGGIFALEIGTGKKVWETPAPALACKPGCSAAQQAPATAIPGIVFSGSLDGHLRAYDETDGTILWDFDSAIDFQTVNGVQAHGGSMNYAGPVVANGMLFVTSGYSINTGMPGNVLLAFTEGGK